MCLRALAGCLGSRPWLAVLALAPVLGPVPLAAQVPFEQDSPRSRLRDRYRNPQNSAKLNDHVRRLRSDDPEERLEAIRGLGELKDPQATEQLLAAASDPDPRIRIKAIDTLGHMKAKEATPLLIQQLFMRDTDLGTKQRILACLGKIGDTRATRPLIDFMARDLEPAVRGNAIFALGDIGDPAALPSLEAVVQNGASDPLRRLAEEAVRKIRARPAPAVVPPALAVDRRGPGAPQPAP